MEQAGSCRHCGSHPSAASSIARSVMHVLYTFLQYFPHAVINWIQILRTWRPQLRLDKLSSFSNNAIVARARWAFPVSQGSVETLFRWGGKRLHRIAANLFRKLCAKFHHNSSSFAGDITENILVSFFRTQCTSENGTIHVESSCCSREKINTGILVGFCVIRERLQKSETRTTLDSRWKKKSSTVWKDRIDRYE